MRKKYGSAAILAEAERRLHIMRRDYVCEYKTSIAAFARDVRNERVWR